MTSEAYIHFELYRHLQNAIQKGAEYFGIKFTDVRPEVKVNGGYADIVLYIEGRKPFLVIEAKRKAERGYKRDIDPYSPKVINQGFQYAAKLGANYFATYNGDTLVLFHTFEEGTHLLDRKTSAYLVKKISDFASSFLYELAGLAKGAKKWDPRHKAFIKRLSELHSRLKTKMVNLVNVELEKNKSFKEKFETWLKIQGWSIDNFDDILLRFGAQSAYLLMNKLVFYKILKSRPAYKKIPKIDLDSSEDFSKVLKNFFLEIIKEIDFEAIYEQDPIYDEIPLDDDIKFDIHEFLEELEQYDLTQFDHDVIGKIYEKIIPQRERHDLGQYYTPKEIVELIIKTSILNANDKVLDPGCGSGGFLVGAYERLKSLKKKENVILNHNNILQQLYGIDINRFPIHLSAINLALRDLDDDIKSLNLEVQDFFNINPHQDRIVVEFATVSGVKKVIDPEKLNVPVKVDVIVGNPPYIRQEKIVNKELCRKHLKRIGSDKISNKSDIYVYFFTHATEFLRENGRLGFITSNKWLTTQYGGDLQNFFLQNYKIQAVIDFSKSVFEEVLVPTCVTLLIKCKNNEERNENTVKFIHVKRKINLDTLIQKLNESYEPEILYEDTGFRIISKRQKELFIEKKWNKFLNAPLIYWEIVSHPLMKRLNENATISRRITTGCNKFFYIKQSDEKKWGIKPDFLKAVAKSLRQTDSIAFEIEDTKYSVINLNKYINSKLKDLDITSGKALKLPLLPMTAKIKELSNMEIFILKSLYEDGYRGLYKYIIHNMWEKDWGSQIVPQLRPTCKANRKKNRCWFSLGKLLVPDLMIPETCWERIFVPMNMSELVADRNLYDVYLSGQLDKELVAAILNSSLFKLIREIDGRITGGGASRVVIYEVENMKIPDPTEISSELVSKIKESFNKLLYEKIDSINFKTNLKKLDHAILSALNLEHRTDDLLRITNALSVARRKGVESDVLLEGLEDTKIRKINLKGGKKVYSKQQKSLLDFR